MTPAQELDALKRNVRAVLNRELARAGLPLKSPVVGNTRKLTPAEINEIKTRVGIASPQRHRVEVR